MILATKFGTWSQRWRERFCHCENSAYYCTRKIRCPAVAIASILLGIAAAAILIAAIFYGTTCKYKH
jgi:hypothetical protein